MLTADLVRPNRKGRELRLPPFDERKKARALELAELYLAIWTEGVGSTRDEIEEALDEVAVEPKERLLALGLRKLIEDRAELEAAGELDPRAIRRAVFLRSAARWRALGAEDHFDRAAVLAEAASELGADVETIEGGLFGDLRGAHVLQQAPALTPASLVEAYEIGRVQAVLLRAINVRARIICSSPADYRFIFRRLKFLRLLFKLERHEERGYVVEIDGPFSLFEQVTKYGLSLAMIVPLLETCDGYTLHATVRWKMDGDPLDFHWTGGRLARDGADLETEREPRISDEVSELLERLNGSKTPWRATLADEVLDLAGVGLCVPDLLLEHVETHTRVFVEVMGHWSRDAVWKRVELVEKGLETPIIFAVSARLRVSEAALGEDAPAALYVYKGVMSPKALLEKVEALAAKIASA